MIIIKRSVLFFIFYIENSKSNGNNREFITIKKIQLSTELEKPIYTKNSKNTLVIIDSRVLRDLQQEDVIKILWKLYSPELIYILYFYPFIKERQFSYKSGVDGLDTKDTVYNNNNDHKPNNNLNVNGDNNNNNNDHHQNNNKNNNNHKQQTLTENKKNKENNKKNLKKGGKSFDDWKKNNNKEEHLKLLGMIGKKQPTGTKSILPINHGLNNPFVVDHIVYNKKQLREEIIFLYLTKIQEKNKEIKQIIYITYDKRAETIVNLYNGKLIILYVEKK